MKSYRLTLGIFIVMVIVAIALAAVFYVQEIRASGPVRAMDIQASTTGDTGEATLVGSLGDMKGANSVQCGFEYGTTTSFGQNTPLRTLTAPGQYEYRITGLKLNTIYYWRCKGIGIFNSGNTPTGYSDNSMQFRTPRMPKWDVDYDGATDVLDLIRVGQKFGDAGYSGWTYEDCNCDGTVDILDIIIVAQHL